MTEKNLKAPKQKIMEAAISLFAQKGYTGVGVREIAKTANVNISMISYYYNGKIGILKAIMEEYFEHYFEILSVVDDESKSPEECVRIIVHNLINFIKQNTELAIVAYNAIPFEIAEIDQWKTEKCVQSMNMMRRLIIKFGLDSNDIIEVGTLGPALISIIFTKFVRLPVIKKLWNIKLDDALYERYADTVATLFLYGITGIADHTQNKEL
ncbi:MAG: TetR/AcrR family transcriptional regulator [Candidatus Marinimicrobia bacterium]|nr:TetR/AcrR family transcriptional regulator [Candidatus Neomarinimicrobiota bacterium]